MQVIDGANATGIIDDSTGLLVEGYAVLERDKNKTRKQKHILQKATHGYTEKETRRRRELKQRTTPASCPDRIPAGRGKTVWP